MTKSKLIFFTFLAIVNGPTFAVVYYEESVQKQIEKSDLIVRGTIESISVDAKNRKKIATIFNNGTQKTVEVEGQNSIITSFTLKINEILYGNLKSTEFVEIEMSGGCYDGICLEDSSGFTLEEGKEYVIFLSKDKVNDVFESTSASYSVFEVDNEIHLKRLTDSIIPNPYKPKTNQDSQVLHNLNNLRDEIKELKMSMGQKEQQNN